MKVKNGTNNIAISSVIIRSDGRVDSDKVLLFNRVIKEWYISNDVHFIDNSDINCTHLNGSNFHLNRTGDRLLGRNICAYLKLLRIGYVCVTTYAIKLMTICVLKLILKVFQSVLPPVGRLVGMLEIEDHKESCLQNGFLVAVGRIFDRKRNSIRPTGINIWTIYREKCQSNPSSG